MAVEFGVPAETWRLGAEAADALGETAAALAGAGLRRIVSSPEPKAEGTARILAATLGLPVETRAGLEEHHRLVAQQSPDRDVFVASVRRFFERPEEVVFGTESAAAALDRFRTAVSAVMASSAGDEAIVTHGTVMTLLLAAAGNGDAMAIWSSLALPDHVVLNWPALQRLPA